jgi:hypothetical protein
VRRAFDDHMQRREQLIERCAEQRAELARFTVGLAVPLGFADGALAAASYVRRHGLVFGVSMAVIALLQRRRLLSLLRIAFAAWRGDRSLPLAFGASVGWLAMSQRHGLLKWVQRGFSAWRAYRALRARQAALELGSRSGDEAI